MYQLYIWLFTKWESTHTSNLYSLRRCPVRESSSLFSNCCLSHLHLQVILSQIVGYLVFSSIFFCLILLFVFSFWPFLFLFFLAPIIDMILICDLFDHKLYRFPNNLCSDALPYRNLCSYYLMSAFLIS